MNSTVWATIAAGVLAAYATIISTQNQTAFQSIDGRLGRIEALLMESHK